MNFEKVFGVLTQEFKKEHIDFAVIGGMALQLAVRDSRLTHDIDFIILLKDSEKVARIMTGLGYKALLCTENVANYSGLAEMGRVDFLFAHRKYSLKMLDRAEPKSLLGFTFKVVKPEDLIGLKIQSCSSDSSRSSKDLADIEEIMRDNRKSLDWNLIREYYRLFGRENDLEETLKKIDDTN